MMPAIRHGFHLGINLPALTDPRWNGSNGSNRFPGRAMIDGADGQPINTDVEAVRQWLAQTSNEHTLRSYRKEIERFMLWALIKQGKSLSDLAVSDIPEYSAFLQAPDPEWVGKRVPRGVDWRPFQGPLTSSSIRQSMTILGHCFKWLCNVRYLDFNIFAKDVNRQKQQRDNIDVSRHIPSRAVTWLLAWLDEYQETNKTRKDIRAVFMIKFLVFTGLREAELAAATFGSLYSRTRRDGKMTHMINVLGKGNKTRSVPITKYSMIEEYRVAMGLPRYVLLGDNMPLLLPLRGVRNMTPGAIYKDVKNMLKLASAELTSRAERETDPVLINEMMNDANLLAKASPHWLRHTYATGLASRGKKITVIQNALGHSNLKTTQVYITTEEDEMYDEIARD